MRKPFGCAENHDMVFRHTWVLMLWILLALKCPESPAADVNYGLFVEEHPAAVGSLSVVGSV